VALYLFLATVLPLAVFTAVSVTRVSQIIEARTLQFARQAFAQARTAMVQDVEEVVNTSDLLIRNGSLGEVLTKATRDGYTVFEQMADVRDLGRILTDFQVARSVHRIRVYVPDGLVYSHENVNLFSMADIHSASWFRELSSHRGKILWCTPAAVAGDPGPPEPVAGAARLVRHPNDYTVTIGVLRIDIRESHLRAIVESAASVSEAVVYMERACGELVTANDPAGARRIQEEIRTLQDKSWSSVIVSDNQMLVNVASIDQTDWQLVSATPLRQIQAESRRLRNALLVLVVFVGVFSLAAAYPFARSEANTIRAMADHMSTVVRGRFAKLAMPPRGDEIGELVHDFNFMIERLEELMNERYEHGRAVKAAEVRALQAQINPHFLYNTLDLINWMAARRGVADIRSVVQSLAQFYKLSLGEGNDVVTLADELSHVRTYVDIQNHRFDGGIRLVIEAPLELHECPVPKITLQPLVENAIQHGILEKPERAGTVRIAVALRPTQPTAEGPSKDDPEVLEILISDDGVGMEESVVADILTADTSDSSHGYGVKNIDARLSLIYGENAGLSFSSSPGRGTTVLVSIPRQTA
jgi:two-component system sensor histidine kinase YesM